jgi:hypothetical protein
VDLFLGVEEDNGVNGKFPSRKGTVTILRPLPFDLVVELLSDDPSELAVPPFVILPSGETTAVFDLTVDESRQANSREVTLTASAPGWSQGVVTVRLKKNGTGQS